MTNQCIIVTLSNGKRVANFSSPHDFTFTDGCVLPAHDAETSNKLKINFIEDVAHNGDVSLKFELTEDVLEEMGKYMKLYQQKEVDVVFCPLPMIVAIKEEPTLGTSYLYSSPFRAVRIEDRIKKLVSIDKQCI